MGYSTILLDVIIVLQEAVMVNIIKSLQMSLLMP